MMDGDRAISPTEWQASRYPLELRKKITVIHEGIDTDLIRPDPAAAARLARAVIVGGDETSYGPPPAGGKTWKQVMMAEVADRLDLRRMHFVGRIPHPTFIRLLQVSAAHVDLTHPFVLSWSMLDAMAAGALVIGSRTPPVEEVIGHGQNGVLEDFLNIDGIVDNVLSALSRFDLSTGLRNLARETIQNSFDAQRRCVPSCSEK